jgi:hypothetical protein
MTNCPYQKNRLLYPRPGPQFGDPLENIDIAEEGVDYNAFKFNELGEAEFVS